MNSKATKITALYFGLDVEVLFQMESCCIIRFRERDFIVLTVDLVFPRALLQVA
jgi:hypothetical protein